MWSYFLLLLGLLQLCVGLPRQPQLRQDVEVMDSTRVNCKVTATVTYPSTTAEGATPTVTCTNKCKFTTENKDQTYFVGYVYRHFERLENEYGLMVQIRYNRGDNADNSCTLVPSTDNEGIISMHLENNSPCAMTTVPSTTLVTTLPPTTGRTTLPPHTEAWTTVPTTVPVTHDFFTTGRTTLPSTTTSSTTLPYHTPPSTMPTTVPVTHDFFTTGKTTLPSTTTSSTTLPYHTPPSTVPTTVPVTHDFFTSPSTTISSTLPYHTQPSTVPTTVPVTHDDKLTTKTTTMVPSTTAMPTTPVITTVQETTPYTTTTTTVQETTPYTTTTTTAPTTTTTIPPTTTSWVCGSDWVLIGHACFHISTVRGDWSEGQDYCAALGATLASIRSQEEQDGLEDLVDANAWLGLHDMHSEGEHRWEDQTSLSYTNWQPGQPDNSGTFLWWGSGEDCVEMNTGYSLRWNDQDCDNQNIYICRSNAVLMG